MPGTDPGSAAPLFRFVQINDLHVQATDPALPAVAGYAGANEKAGWVIEAINSERFCPLPQFVVGIGDLIHGEVPERLAPDLATWLELSAALRCPLYPLVGNHEVIQQERSTPHLTPYRAAFGDQAVDYSFEFGGILFIAINNGGGDNPANGKARREWLRPLLAEHRRVPKILLCHIPLVPLREQATLAASFGFSSYIDADGGMLELIEEHAGSIIAVLSGHLHLTGMVRRNGIVHVSLSGTASYPSDGAISYQVFADRIEAEVHAIPPHLAQASPTLHGRPRHPADFTDSLHPDAHSYQCGLAVERRFVIELPPAV